MSRNLVLRKRIKNVFESEKAEKTEKSSKINSKTFKNLKTPPITTPKSDIGLKVNNLRLLIKEDMKKTMDRLSENRLTRDISHIQDKRMSSMISLPILPTDIEVLKKLQQCECFNFHATVSCKREQCIKEASVHQKKSSTCDLTESIDKILIGNPTGRQDIKELCTWFHSMLTFHQNASIDTIMLIYDQCAKELIRQVAVHCIERGELLQVLFKYQADMYQKKQEENEKKIESQKIAQKLEIKQLNEKYKKRQKDLENKISNLLKRIENSKNEKEKILDELNKCRKLYNESVRQYMEEEKMWKKKHFGLLMKLRESFVPFKVGEHELSVVNWVEKRGEGVDEQVEIVRQEILEYEAICLENSKEKKEFLVEILESQHESEELMNEEEDKNAESSFEEGVRVDSLENECGVAELTEENQEQLIEIGEKVVSQDLIVQDSVINHKDGKGVNEIGLVDETEKENSGINTLKNTENEGSLMGPINNPQNLSEYPPEIVTDTNQIMNDGLKVTEDSKTPEKSLLSLSTTSTNSFYPSLKKKSLHFTLEHEIEIIPEDSPITQTHNFNPPQPKQPQSRKSKKRLFKVPNRISRDLIDNKPLKKHLEMQEMIESLKHQLQQKSSQLSELSSQQQKFSLGDRLKINIVSSSLAKSTGILSPTMSSPRENERFLSPPLNLTRENSANSLIRPPESCKDIESEVDEKFIPAGCDVYSWKAGFSMGFEKGRTEGVHIGELLGIEEGKFENIDQDKEDYERKSPDLTKKNRNFNRGSSLKTDFMKQKIKEFTKVMQFQFNTRPGGVKKQHPVYALITKIMMDRESIGKATLSRKILNKMISAMLMNCLNRIRNGDSVESLVEQVYDDFYQKYGLKLVCEKRFTEFLASLFFHTPSRRVTVFLRLLGFGSKFNMSNYSKKSFLFYLSCLSFMMTSKIGIIIVFDEIADMQMFPTQRGIDCLKERLENICEKNVIYSTIEEILNQSEPDKKGLNPSGLIELELVLELAVNIYEEYQNKIEAGVNLLIEAFSLGEGLSCTDLIMFVRNINSEKFEFGEEEKIDNKRIAWHSFCKDVEFKDYYSVFEAISKCSDYGLLKLEDVYKFNEEGGSMENDFIETRFKSIFEDFSRKSAGKKNKLEIDNLLERLKDLVLNLEGNKLVNKQLAFHILSNELNRQIYELNLT